MARSLKQHFTDWCREQGEVEYDYGDVSNCALCQFLNANGYTERAIVGGSCWREFTSDQRHDLDRVMVGALLEKPHTFAALADRLSA